MAALYFTHSTVLLNWQNYSHPLAEDWENSYLHEPGRSKFDIHSNSNENKVFKEYIYNEKCKNG
jgi:hypothetical protein